MRVKNIQVGNILNNLINVFHDILRNKNLKKSQMCHTVVVLRNIRENT